MTDPQAISHFVLSRTLDHPVDKVYRAWTQEQALASWFGPKGLEMIKTSLDLRPGGTFHYGMRTPDGSEIWGKWTFHEIVPGEKIVFVVSFSDAQGGVTRHPMAATWPLEVLSTIRFIDEGDKTRLVMEAVPVNASPEEIATFNGAHDGMNQGWAGTFEQLEAALAAM